MARIEGPSHVEIAQRGAGYDRLLVSTIRRTLRVVVKTMDTNPTVDDLGRITWYWTKEVDERLLPRLEKIARDTAAAQRSKLVHPTLRADAAPQVDDPASSEPFDVPAVTNPLAEEYLAAARNRLVNVGNDVWEEARNQLLDGLRAGSNIETITDMIVNATDLAAPRAGVIARTEINGVMNLSSIEQMRQLAVDGITKEWLAVGDSRTRPTHLAANGQVVPIAQPFIVGGEALDAPSQPNCRCTMTYDLP